MELLYQDNSIAVVLKPFGVLSTDEPGGVPDLLRSELGLTDVRTVHRLDRVAGGVMVLALNAAAASELSRQIRENLFSKEYFAVIHWQPRNKSGTFRDLLVRDKNERKTYVAKVPSKETREAILNYDVIASDSGLSLVRIRLITGRTHQIRCQFSSRALPLVGDKKYGTYHEDCPLALWSCSVSFSHPVSNEKMIFSHTPPDTYPWNQFSF